MDETDRLARRVVGAFQNIPELDLEWILVPEDLRQPGVTLEMEVKAAGEFPVFEVSGKLCAPVDLLDGKSEEDLRLLFREELLLCNEFRRAVTEARVLTEAARDGEPSPEEARRN